MKILITGICGFVGSTLARAWIRSGAGHTIFGLDNLIRPGSETNRQYFRDQGVSVFHADIRNPSDFESLPDVDFVLDAAANPSVLAGIDGQSSSRQVVEHNLGGTINLLEFCKARRAGLILLSTSRVYSVESLLKVRVEPVNQAFVPVPTQAYPPGCSAGGVSEDFPTTAPISLYGATKVASETLALEYGHAFNLPIWINRCGVLAGAGQFGHAEQGIFSYWIHAWAQRRPLRYLGFGGTGLQVRDALHPEDLLSAIDWQMNHADTRSAAPARIFNLAGGTANSLSLANLSHWCHQRLGPHAVAPDPTPRPYDIPWLALDCSRAQTIMGWRPVTPLPMILEQIADFAQQNPRWLEMSLFSTPELRSAQSPIPKPNSKNLP